jgi:two-component system, chemotaxis family, chemotaxis protein CheY
MESTPKVLILELDALQRDAMASMLKRSHFSPISCSHPNNAAALLAEFKPALLIINIVLPEQNGLDFIKEMRKLGLLDATKVLVISPLGFPDVVFKAARAGAADFLVKPFDPEQLIQRARQLTA